MINFIIMYNNPIILLASPKPKYLKLGKNTDNPKNHNPIAV